VTQLPGQPPDNGNPVPPPGGGPPPPAPGQQPWRGPEYPPQAYPQQPYPPQPYPAQAYPAQAYPPGPPPWAAPYAPQAPYVPEPATPHPVRRKLYLLLVLPPFGLTTWAPFLYIGIRARRAVWLAWAAVYLAAFVAFVVISSPAKTNSTAEGIAVAVGMAAWIGGGIHAVAISGNAMRRIYGAGDPLLAAGKNRIERRAAGRRLLATQPALAREVGLGRPDLPGTDDYGLVDVNHAAAAGLERIPGVSAALAQQIVSTREQCGSFSSVEDLGSLLNLSPTTVDQMRDVAVFIPG
jgi:Helix-hairpin-helix motif